MDIRESGAPVLYRHGGSWHTGVLRQWRRDGDQWIGDVWLPRAGTMPIPAADLRSAQACHWCPVKARRPGYV